MESKCGGGGGGLEFIYTPFINLTVLLVAGRNGTAATTAIEGFNNLF